MSTSSVRTACRFAILIAMALLAVLPGTASAANSARGSAATSTYASESTTSLKVSAPQGAQPGDLIVTAIGFGRSGATTQPVLTAPAGWTLVTRTDQGSAGSLAIYRHWYASGESSYTWTTNVAVGGTLF